MLYCVHQLQTVSENWSGKYMVSESSWSAAVSKVKDEIPVITVTVKGQKDLSHSTLELCPTSELKINLSYNDFKTVILQ